MNKGLIYIHGKGGTAKEAEHYKILFPEYDVSGLDYEAKTPWEAQEEFRRFFDLFRTEHDDISIVANSIGAFFAMNALSDRKIEKAYFISPIVDMEKLIIEMINQEHISEKELFEKGIIETEYGETLSWEYLLWIRQNPVTWTIPTCILYGEKDNLQSIDTIRAFADRIGAGITIMENGEHWFHTEKQMKFLDNWLHDVS
ncbi:MAG: alpha/beta hydrolase [Ruminococcus sp.]|nr:alpha/beta hydrolase [Ruminococcus sp.]